MSSDIHQNMLCSTPTASKLRLIVIFTLGRPSTMTPEDGDTPVGLSQS